MKKLCVFMLDALCSSDIEKMKELKNFSYVIENGSYVRSIEPVYPALTYCCHTSIVTGCYVDRHGIYNNEWQKRGMWHNELWFGKKEQVKVKTILDYARENGLTTASIFWPVTAGADYTYNWPMYVPYHYEGEHPEDWLKDGMASKNVLDEYGYKYLIYQMGDWTNNEVLTLDLSIDIIKDHGQPDVMFIKMCDLDTIRHTYGVYSAEAYKQLRKHDIEFGKVLETIRRYGDFDNTNFVILGDHGQTNVEKTLNMNVLLKQAGFIRDENDWDCIAHSFCLTCNIELRNPDDEAMKKRVKDYLKTLIDDPEIQLAYVLDKDEMLEKYHLDGPFDFVIESRRDIAFGYMDSDELWTPNVPGDHHNGAATHGSRPDRVETTTFLACGPSVKKGVVIEKRSMVDEAVTMAAFTGFDMPDTDGRLMEEMICK